jgi:DNA (cytosine-5)-methyltransferase 1
LDSPFEREFRDSNAWREADRILCNDGKTRLIESGTFPLAHGIPARALKLRAFGNAIVPQVAAEFIAAFRECQP